MSIPERILTFMTVFPVMRPIALYQFNPVQALTTAPSYTVPTCHLSQWACFSRVLPETYGAFWKLASSISLQKLCTRPINDGSCASVLDKDEGVDFAMCNAKRHVIPLACRRSLSTVTHSEALALNDQVSIDVNLKLRSQMTFYRRNGSPNIERINCT